MAAGTFTLYKANLDDLRIQDLLGATVKIALVSSSYTPNVTTSGHDEWADISTNEIGTTGGYTTGGATVANDVATAVTNGWKYASDNVSWTAASGNISAWRYAVMYVSGSLWGKTSPVIGYFLGDSTPADTPATSDGNTLTLACPANGWFDIQQS